MSKYPLAIRHSQAQGSNTFVLLLLGLAVLFFLFKSKTNLLGAGSYKNSEEWNVEYNSDGLPSRIVISRDAKRG